MTVGLLDLGGAAISYDVTGDAGPLAVQLHGLTSSRSRDAQLGLDLGRALHSARVLRYDARGHGRSTGDTDPASYGWDRLADDLLRLLDEVAPGERVHGVGPSMGTGTLLHAAVRDPERFASLTLVVPPTAWTTRTAQAETYRRNARFVEREGVDALVELGSSAPVPPALADAPESYPAVDAGLLPTVLRGAAETDFPPVGTLRAISTPTLVLAWAGDPAHPLSTAEKLREIIPGSVLSVARSPHEVLGWAGRFAEHVGAAARRAG
ncbi:alpha/beta hydrolase [Microbacterium hatanonis]|jgi:3-oxoadipate enol-lactonase|uniref:Alpha/beta hydrolase n=1 Tax=Microbacterium hatanonis TaxID=404366 RepID=A0A5C8HXQ5_9MICO|nr:alpha/beta hydrolase [Microbacterium hatanonis]